MNDLRMLVEELNRLRAKVEQLERKEHSAGGLLLLVDGMTAPGAVAGWGQLYIDTADGDLKVKYGDGTVKTIAMDT